MKIYLYVPETAGVRSFVTGGVDRWWPDGITVPKVQADLFPIPTAWPWKHADGHYPGYPEFWPITELPAFHRSLLAATGHGEPLVRGARGIAEVAAVTFDDTPGVIARAIDLPDAIYVSRSEVVRLQDGEAVALMRRWFREDAVSADVFASGPFELCPDVYLTEAFVERARAAVLRGTEAFELVWDGAPCGPPHPPLATLDGHQGEAGLELIEQLLEARASIYGYSRTQTHERVRELARNGWIDVGQTPGSARRGFR